LQAGITSLARKPSPHIFDDKTDFVLGYGGYLNKNGLLNKYIRYDCMTTQCNTWEWLSGEFRIWVSEGTSRTKGLFFLRIKASVQYNHVISGDDDLFVNSNANELNTAVEFRHTSHTRSLPVTVSVNGKFKRGDILLQHLT